MSPSIHTKSRSLTLADQAMGLTSFPIPSQPSDELKSTTPAAITAVVPPVEMKAAIVPLQSGLSLPLPSTLQERQAALEGIRCRHRTACAEISTDANTPNLVEGEGSPLAELVFVGEFPGDNEAMSGKPFQGESGAKLDDMIKAMGLSRERVFLTYVVKYPPRLNQAPTRSEVELGMSFLTEQLLVIRPKVIVPLGGPAAQQLLKVDEGISKLRGKWGVWKPPAGWDASPIPVMPTFHPAYLLRNYTQETRSLMWSDLRLAMTKLGSGTA